MHTWQMGFRDAKTLEQAQKLSAILSQNELEQLLADTQRRQSRELPDHESPDPDRRANLVRDEAADTPERISEQRPRSVFPGDRMLKPEAADYLSAQYTNSNGELTGLSRQLPFPAIPSLWRVIPTWPAGSPPRSELCAAICILRRMGNLRAATHEPRPLAGQTCHFFVAPIPLE